MNERDRGLALEVFGICLARVGAKEKTDRLFLEAFHYFTVYNHHMAGLARAFRELEQHLEALQPALEIRRI